ncbi:MAG: hypothetical protein WD360_04805 [Nitriliruptoraceae bacterium]
MSTTTLRNAAQALLAFTPRRIAGATFASVVTFLLLGLTTAMIENPVFGRSIATPTWGFTALTLTSVLSGIILATYVATPLPPDTETATRRFTAGGVLAFFAIGCPTCNKLVLIALGSSGAITWFAPIQPYLATAGIVLLGWVAITRLANDTSCRLPQHQ